VNVKWEEDICKKGACIWGRKTYLSEKGVNDTLLKQDNWRILTNKYSHVESRWCGGLRLLLLVYVHVDALWRGGPDGRRSGTWGRFGSSRWRRRRACPAPTSSTTCYFESRDLYVVGIVSGKRMRLLIDD
jgi:hypothetical protein